MKATIILLCIAPFATMAIASGPTSKAIVISQVFSLWALLIGFPIDWWRLQKRKKAKIDARP